MCAPPSTAVPWRRPCAGDGRGLGRGQCRGCCHPDAARSFEPGRCAAAMRLCVAKGGCGGFRLCSHPPAPVRRAAPRPARATAGHSCCVGGACCQPPRSAASHSSSAADPPPRNQQASLASPARVPVTRPSLPAAPRLRVASRGCGGLRWCSHPPESVRRAVPRLARATADRSCCVGGARYQPPR